MKRKLFTLLLCMVFICTLSLPVYADSTTTSSDGYSALISDIPKTCPTCGSSLHASWFSTSGAEVELTINDNGTIKIPAGAGVVASIRLYCTNCKYEKNETRLLGLDWGSERPGEWKVEQAPSGIGRKDLPGYNNYDTGTPAVNPDGTYSGNFAMVYDGYVTPSKSTISRFTFNTKSDYSNCSSSSAGDGNVSAIAFYDDSPALSNVYVRTFYYFQAPVTGYYDITIPSISVSAKAKAYNGNYYSNFATYARWFLYVAPATDSAYDEPYSSSVNKADRLEFYKLISGKYEPEFTTDSVTRTFYVTKGNIIQCGYTGRIGVSMSSTGQVWQSIAMRTAAPTIVCRSYADSSDNKLTNQTNITINNTTWNGNIYTDNSTNLTYIYPQYTTINEKNETVTNISNTPIIYNNETKQYYTYDQTTKNYYYITYNAQPTPSPSPTPDPDTTPTPTPKPGGSISTPETGKPGGSSGSGQSWWDKLLDKIGNAVIDGLLGAVSAVLKLIFKLFSTILGWIIWAVSLVFTLFPFLPPGVSGLLVGGVVVCFIIGIIKFIRG